MNRWLARIAALSLCTIFVGCASMDKYSFETFGRPKQKGALDPNEGPVRSDWLAMQYSDHVAKLLEGRATGSRVTREASDSALVLGGALAAAQETLGIAASTVAQMGVGAVVIRELQGVFNARGRSEAFADAAYLVRQAQAEYRAFNPNPSTERMTENGATLVRRVDSALFAARKTLNGRMPTLLDLQQATQPMSVKGASKTSVGETHFLATATGDVPLPQLRARIEGAPNEAPPPPPAPLDIRILRSTVVGAKERQTDPLPEKVVKMMEALDPIPAGLTTGAFPRTRAGLDQLFLKNRDNRKGLEAMLDAMQ